MRAFRSLRVQFTGWYLLVLAVLLIALGSALYIYLSYTLQRSQDESLRVRAEQLAGSREVRTALNEGQVEEGLGELVAFFQEEGDGYRVIAARLVENDIDIAWIDAALNGRSGYYTVERGDGTFLRFYISRLLPPGVGGPPRDGAGQAPLGDMRIDESVPTAPVVLVIGQPMDRTRDALAALRAVLLISIPLTLVLSAGGGAFLVRRALKPVDQLTEAAREIEEADLSRRVSVRSNDEIGRLACTFNAMLGRLERAFHRQRQFTDDASHELRSPLSVIEAEATMALRKERSADDYRDALGIIVDESATMKRLIDQLLTLARGDAGEEALDAAPIDMGHVAEETVYTMRPLAEEKGIALEHVSHVSGPLFVFGDETQLRRVLANLAENAIRHTDKGGEIRIDSRHEEHDIVWEIVDTGSGIAAEHLPHVFERFYRADKARSRASGGSGLGLAICQQIVTRHGGTITVASEEGVGTSFQVRLPAMDSSDTVSF